VKTICLSAETLLVDGVETEARLGEISSECLLGMSLEAVTGTVVATVGVASLLLAVLSLTRSVMAFVK
jgi:hypothetical protein